MCALLVFFIYWRGGMENFHKSAASRVGMGILMWFFEWAHERCIFSCGIFCIAFIYFFACGCGWYKSWIWRLDGCKPASPSLQPYVCDGFDIFLSHRENDRCIDHFVLLNSQMHYYHNERSFFFSHEVAFYIRRSLVNVS